MKHEFTYEGEKHNIQHGTVVLAAITSCTNTSNPDVMIAAGLVAKKAVEKGIKYLLVYSGSKTLSRPACPQAQVSSLST